MDKPAFSFYALYMMDFECLWGEMRAEDFEFQLEEPDEEFETPEVAPHFDYDARPFHTDEVFDSHEELFNWAFRTAKELGYVLIKRRTNSNLAGVKNKITIACNLSEKKDNRIIGLVKKTLKCECPFRLVGRLTSDGGWTVTVIDDTHNHYPANNLGGYAYARRLTEEEKSFLEAEYHRGTPPKRMLKLLKDKFPGNLTRNEDIYNFQTMLRKKAAEKHGNTPMQVMFSLLKEHNYLYYHTTNSVSGRLENLFFIHPTSFKLWRAFPYVIEIDATYKTNLYNMPLVEIVGVTPTNRTFSIAYAFIVSEQEHNYRWVLECLKSTLGEGFAVRVVLTDRDLALMKACKTVMPEAYHLLCRVHIWRNIEKFSMPSLKGEGKWGPFYEWWKKLYQSRTLEEYTKNEKDLKEKMGPRLDKVYKYLQKEWLSPYKEMFVSFWVDQHLNYRNYTTNRVEAEHSLLKSELKGRCTFHRIIQCVNDILLGQNAEIQGQLEESRIYCFLQVPNSNRPTAHTAPSGLQKSKSVQFSRPTFQDTQSMGGFSDRFSQSSLFGEGQYGRHSEYVSTQSRFFDETDIQPQWPQSGRQSDYVGTSSIFAGTASFFEEFPSQPQWAESGRHSEYMGTESRGPNTTNFFHEPYNQPDWGQTGRQSDYLFSESRFSDTQSYLGDPYNQTQGETSSFVDKIFGGLHTQNVSELVTHNFFESETTWTDLRTYLTQLPLYFQRYVVDIKNVKSDGNCGFRALAVALGENENLKFEWIRTLMLEEYESKVTYYENAFGGEASKIHTLLSISYPNGRPYEHWMMIPYCAMLLSNALGVIIICLSVKENITCFPFWKGPGQLYRDDPICIGLVSGNSHFVTVYLDNNCPLPYPSAWGLDKPAARAWAEDPKYKYRLAEYKRHIQATKARPGFLQID